MNDDDRKDLERIANDNLHTYKMLRMDGAVLARAILYLLSKVEPTKRPDIVGYIDGSRCATTDGR